MEDCLSTNAEKGERVAAFVADYIARYEGGHGEPPETVLYDIIADLGHWYATLPADQREECNEDYTLFDHFQTICNNAQYHFECEIKEAIEEEGWK
jgi:hypothetical protein